MKSYHTIAPYFRRHLLRLLVGLAALLVVDLLQLFIPRVIKHAVDQLAMQTATPMSVTLAGLTIFGLAAAIGVFRFVWRLLILGFSRIVEKELRLKLYAKLLTLPPSWFMNRTTGDIMAHATNDLDAVRMASGMGLVALLRFALVMGTASLGIHDLDQTPVSALLALIPMPLIPVLTK